ncbi:MAG: hypothetical protein ACYC2I_11745 [Elusimicrobiales bacterium]
MKYVVKLLALALCFAASDAAAWPSSYQVSEMIMVGMPSTRVDYMQRMVRPYRDRTERFQSARTEALQMSLAIGDESDQLTLESWGDNRADLRKGSSRVQLQYGRLSGDGYTGDLNDGDYPGDRAGFYGRFGSFEAEVSRLRRDEKDLTTPSEAEHSVTSAGAGFSFGGEALRLGLHGNMGVLEHSNSGQEYNNHAVGGALALKTGLFELGATADFVDRSAKSDTMDDAREGPMVGGQAIIKLPGGLKGGLRASSARLSGDSLQGGNKFDFEGVNNEIGARAEWNFPVLPLTVAASFDHLYMDPEYSISGVARTRETDSTVKTLGAAFKPFGGRLLLGAEIKDLEMEITSNFAPAAGIEANSLTAGAELWLLPGLAVRASFQRFEFGTNGAFGSGETLYNVIAGGAGLKGENFTLDASVRRQEEDPDDGGMGDRMMEVKLMLGYKF